METALHLCDWHDLTLHAPYLHLTKADIVKIGINLGVDYALTWTCYRERTGPAGSAGPASSSWRRSGSRVRRIRWITGEERELPVPEW